MKSVSLTTQIEAAHLAIKLVKPGSRRLSRREAELLESHLLAVIATLRGEVDRRASYNVEPQPFLED